MTSRSLCLSIYGLFTSKTRSFSWNQIHYYNMSSDKRRKGRIQGAWADSSPQLCKAMNKSDEQKSKQSHVHQTTLPTKSTGASKERQFVYEQPTKIEGATPQQFLDGIVRRRFDTAKNIIGFESVEKRTRLLSQTDKFPDKHGGVVYWMSRDQRVQDNWALLFAQKLTMTQSVPLHVCFCLVPKFLEATIRQFGFMLKGLQNVEKECRDLGIQFKLLTGYAKDVLPQFLQQNNIGGLVTDFSPLRVPSQWVQDVKTKIPESIPFYQVDAHNVVPCWEASGEQEFGARTIRRKIKDQFPTYLTEFPPVVKHPYPAVCNTEEIDWESAYASLEVDFSVPEVEWATPGMEGGLLNLEVFLRERLRYYHSHRNKPNHSAQSNMSPWLHFGHVSAQRILLLVQDNRSKPYHSDGVSTYIDQLIIRRELTDNYCFYNQHYDQLKGTDDWAIQTLENHRKDKRDYLYTRQQFEDAETHDSLWNAAQIQMMREGKMQGFLRMYWAKKILEWTETAEQALEYAIYLNDKYQLDGRDPNGYVGIMWSICGLHDPDQGWPERPVYGKIRYMSYNGCLGKFDVPAFINKYNKESGSKKE